MFYYNLCTPQNKEDRYSSVYMIVYFSSKKQTSMQKNI